MAISAVNSISAPLGAQFNSARRASDPFAQALSSAMNAGPASPTQLGNAQPSDGSLTISELRAATDNSFAEFKRTLKQVFAENQVNTTQAIRLEPDGQGGVTVVGRHPDRDKIEKIFKDNPDLAAKFQILAKRFTDLKAAESPKEQQPLIGPEFGILIQNDDYQVRFRGGSGR